MSRCAICDYSSELSPGPKKRVEWSKKHKAFHCVDCHHDIFKMNKDLQKEITFHYDIGELPMLELEDKNDSVSVEELDILEEFGMEDD